MPAPRRQAVIVGAGPAGDGVAAGMRDAGFAGDIKLIGAEPEPPYERPHLSKGYLLGTVARERLALRPGAQYRELAVDLVLGERVSEVDVEHRLGRLESGRALPWGGGCLATRSAAGSPPGGGGATHPRRRPAARRLCGRDER